MDSTDLDIPAPADILIAIDSFDPAIESKALNELERRGYQAIRRMLMYAYYCSLRDGYEREERA